MVKRVLLLGVQATLLDDVRQQVQLPDIELRAGTGVDDVRSAFAHADLDHVIVGGGLDLETRLAVVREVFQSSDRATVHLKDHLSGPEGFIPFVRAVLIGVNGYQPHASQQAVLRVQRPSSGRGPGDDG